MIGVRPFILFDLDATLVDHEGAAAAAITGWIADAGFPLEVGGVDSARIWFDIAEAHFPDYFAGRVSFREQRRQRIAQFLPLMGVPTSTMTAVEFDEQFMEYRRRYEAAWRPFPDAVRALHRLAGSHRIAVLTNGDQAQQDQKMQRTGLADLVEQTIATSSIGIAKPDPEAFHRALATLNAAPQLSTYVGDQLDTDARAARAAGLTGIWLDRTGTRSAASDVRTIVSLSLIHI